VEPSCGFTTGMDAPWMGGTHRPPMNSFAAGGAAAMARRRICHCYFYLPRWLIMISAIIS
jgi:hypothetical protein